MYIPIGPSKKQLYKIVIALLLLCYILFLGMYKPKAQVWTEWEQHSFNPEIMSDGQKDYSITPWKNKFPNKTGGYVLFNFFTSGSWSLPQITIFRSSASGFTCDIGTYNFYRDSDVQATNYTVKCPIDFWDDGLVKINIRAWVDTRAGDQGWQLGNWITYVANDITEEDLQNIINNMNTDTQSIINAINRNNQTQQNIQNNTQNISDNINDSSIDSSSSSDFTNNSAFQDSNGLDAIIKAPLNFIQSLTSSTCSSISLTIPYIDAQVSLPCMSTIYNKALGQQLVNLIALVINGVVLYRYCLKILQLVHNAKNPNKDELEVLDL